MFLRFNVAILLAALIQVTLGGGALAAHAEVWFKVKLYSYCIEYYAPAGKTVTLALLGANGELKGSAEHISDPHEQFRLSCFDTYISPGDRLREWHFTFHSADDQGERYRDLVIPRLEVLIDRATNVVSGRSPPGVPVKISATRQELFARPQTTVKSVRANTQGTFSSDFTGIQNLSGHDLVKLSWGNSFGDEVSLSVEVPSITVWYRSAAVSVYRESGAPANLELRSSTGKVLAKGVGIRENNNPYASTRVWRNGMGAEVSVAAGHRVEGDFAGEVSLLIPTVEIRADSTTDKISGQCMPNSPYSVQIRQEVPAEYPYLVSTYRYGTTAANGTFNRVADYDVLRRAEVTLFCRYPEGDAIGRATLAKAGSVP